MGYIKGKIIVHNGSSDYGLFKAHAIYFYFCTTKKRKKQQ